MSETTLLPDDKIRENAMYRLKLADDNIAYYRAKLDNIGLDGNAWDVQQAALHLNDEQLKRAMLTDILYNRGAF